MEGTEYTKLDNYTFYDFLFETLLTFFKMFWFFADLRNS